MDTKVIGHRKSELLRVQDICFGILLSAIIMNITLDLCIRHPIPCLEDDAVVKEWFWQSFGGEIKMALAEGKTQFSFGKQLHLLHTVARVQREFLDSGRRQVIFNILLDALLELSKSCLYA